MTGIEEELRMLQEKLPRVGQEVRSKMHGTLWRIMEKREVWQNMFDDAKPAEPLMVPAVYLSFWRVREGVLPGVGKMMGFVYTLHDNTFDANWEVI